MSVGRNLVGCVFVDATCPSGEYIQLALHHPIGIVAGETHLALRTLENEKILGDIVDALDVWIMATGALDAALHQLYRAGCICGCALRYERRHQVRLIFQRSLQAERVRPG